MKTVSDYFGELVFNDEAMQARLPKDTYRAMQQTIYDGRPLDISVANIVANAMKDWAVEKGATHFTHWFQPMTGVTAEKHDSFIADAGHGKIIMEFGGKELVRGEPDASSFPSGGLRATFEARGYTAWDPTSYAFIKDRTLCIPTAFCSYGGQALDKKTPLLRSMQAINKQALRVLALFGKTDVTSVHTTVGLEQEYFLITKEDHDRRRDLVCTGRTLFGAHAPKGQELDDHYFGALAPRVSAFMEEVDRQLWQLGILAKTEHNEVAPAQHELAPIFTTANIAVDHNQLTMEVLQKVAKKHGLVCLLHEKPFAGVNGSGKHNNWSITTNTGVNLLEPGDTPHDNAQFLLFLCAVIQAVDDYQDLLRISVASAGNDHRLGANEAPPAVVSMFIGQELNDVLESIDADTAYTGREKQLLRVGVRVLPRFAQDATDRNRTSPFAFTGNKFEFRMLGSAASAACANMMLNTAVAESLRQFADALEGAEDFAGALHDLIRRTIHAHRRIIFNGNGYDDAWLAEAARRGLADLRTTADCIPCLLAKKNVELFARHKVLSETELAARADILLENYCKTLHIEALTMLDIAGRDILPAVSRFGRQLAETMLAKKAALPQDACSYEAETLAFVNSQSARLYQCVKALQTAVEAADALPAAVGRADAYKTGVLPVMQQLRAAADALESVTDKALWPMPTYSELLFDVR